MNKQKVPGDTVLVALDAVIVSKARDEERAQAKREREKEALAQKAKKRKA